MPILVDFSQYVTGIITADLYNESKKPTNHTKNMIRHIFFMSLLKYKAKFGQEYGDFIFGCDAKSYWRKDFFPNYKSHRKELQEKSSLDWDWIKGLLQELKDEVRDSFRWKVIEVEKAEGDDILAVLAKYITENEMVQNGLFDEEPQPIMILSGDEDFLQLQKYRNVKQWSSKKKSLVKPETTAMECLIEHIVRGDPGDFVPAILSGDNYLVDKIKQPAIRRPYLEKFLEHGEAACETDLERKNWKRNQTLVDFDFIPDNIRQRIIDEYNNYQIRGSRAKMSAYVMRHQLRRLIGEIQNF